MKIMNEIEDVIGEGDRIGDDLAGMLIMDAYEVVTSERNEYGDAVENAEHIADAWTWYLNDRLDDDDEITGADMCRMMNLAKISRGVIGEYDTDHDRDSIGYTGIASACEVMRGNVDAEELTENQDNES